MLSGMPQAMIAPITTIIDNNIFVLFNDSPTNKPSQRGDDISLHRYDPPTDRWSPEPSLPRDFGRTWGAKAVAVGSTMLVAGGGENICARFDVNTRQWSKLALGLPIHNYGSLVVSAGRVFLAGGQIYKDGDLLSDIIDEYIVARDRWVDTGARLPTPLWNHHAVTLDLPGEPQ